MKMPRKAQDLTIEQFIRLAEFGAPELDSNEAYDHAVMLHASYAAIMIRKCYTGVGHPANMSEIQNMFNHWKEHCMETMQSVLDFYHEVDPDNPDVKRSQETRNNFYLGTDLYYDHVSRYWPNDDSKRAEAWVIFDKHTVHDVTKIRMLQLLMHAQKVNRNLILAYSDTDLNEVMKKSGIPNPNPDDLEVLYDYGDLTDRITNDVEGLMRTIEEDMRKAVKEDDRE